MKTEDHIFINGFKHVLYESESVSDEESITKSHEFYNLVDARRSVREYSSQSVSKQVIENIIKSASTAPSGAHKQPWTFCAISNSELKTKIRLAAEIEERETYAKRMTERWRQDLAPLGTDTNKIPVKWLKREAKANAGTRVIVNNIRTELNRMVNTATMYVGKDKVGEIKSEAHNDLKIK